MKCIWVKFKRFEISTIVVKGNEGLNNRVSIIIRIYIDRTRFAVFKGCFVYLIFLYVVVYFVCFCLILHKYHITYSY